jgi:hypothetical protein
MLLEKQERAKQLCASNKRREPWMIPQPAARFRIDREEHEEHQKEDSGAD